MSPEPLQRLLDLDSPPVAVSFLDRAPEGVARVGAASPAGCSYWKLAAEGAVFYTEASDHFGCPVGSHTHGVELPPEKAKELEELVGVMVGLEYLDPSEVASLPRRSAPFRFAVYAPLGQSPCAPDLVLVRGSARQIMLLTEAARAARVEPHSAPMGRPACAAIPATLESRRTGVSLGCIGNRVYTGLGDDELYAAIPGASLDAVTERLRTILRANAELEKFHQARQEAAAGS